MAQDRPWVLQGDFNFEPEALLELGWLQKVRGVPVAPEIPTCRTSSPQQAQLVPQQDSNGTLDEWVILEEVAGPVEAADASR
eukprot:7295107-Pyramimonas_sp.AAC.1